MEFAGAFADAIVQLLEPQESLHLRLQFARIEGPDEAGIRAGFQADHADWRLAGRRQNRHEAIGQRSPAAAARPPNVPIGDAAIQHQKVK